MSTWPPEDQGGGTAPTGETAAVPGLTRAELQARARSGASRQSVAWESVDDTAGMRPDPDSDQPGPDRDGGDRTWFRHHPFRVVVLAAVLAGVALVVGGLAWIDGQANPTGPKGAQVIVAVPQGDGTGQFAGLLQQKGVIGNSLAYRIWSKFHSAPTIYAGSYAFNRNDTFGEVASVLAGGPNVFSLVVPPGFAVSEVAARVGQFPGHDRTAFEQVAVSGTVRSPWQPSGVTNLDGLLGTGTYQVLPGETDAQILGQMVQRFDQQATAAGLTAGAAAIGLTPYQAITMASIVEKEGVIVKNVGPVARVILNRLAHNMPLQMDSTVLYAEGRDGGTVTSKDLATVTPYNTYLNKGLTPTPICFPSAEALQATLHPPAGAWLYFVVVQSDGTEAFADTYAQQQANEALAARRGLP